MKQWREKLENMFNTLFSHFLPNFYVYCLSNYKYIRIIKKKCIASYLRFILILFCLNYFGMCLHEMPISLWIGFA